MNSLEEILANTRADPATGCRIWLRYIDPQGYGRVWWQGKMHRVHRVVWELLYGSAGVLDVLHTCDHRPCCEPEHLFLGTQQDNNKDSMLKGRRSLMLTEGQVKEIRALLAKGLSQNEIAGRYGVNQSSISQIVRNVTWKHVL